MPTVPAAAFLMVAAGMRSDYQLFKRQVMEVLPLSKDAIHIYIGVACLGVSIFVLRMAPSAWRSLLLGVAASLVMEGLDLRDNVRYPMTVRLVESARDLVNTNLAPFLFVFVTRLRLGRPAPARKKKG